MKNITYLDNDTLPECVYKNKQNILAIIDEIAKTYGLDFKGVYNSEFTYNKNNVVVYDNKTYVYISTVTTSNILPTNTQFWALWIDPKPGAQGEKGEPGAKGENGGEVESVVKISTVENVDTYRMTFSNSYTSDFTVTNGKDGQNGQNGQNGKGIESITLLSSTESSSTYRISYGDGLTFDFTVQNGVSPTITIGTVTTVASTENARVENSGSEKSVVLDFYLPKGDPGVSVNAEVVSEQTADDTQKVYSVGFINGILGNFTGQINSIYSDLAKKFGFDTNSILFTVQGLYLQTTISSKGIYSFSINGRMYLINTDLLTGTESVKVIDDLSIYSSETENAFIRCVVTINPSTGLIRVACWKILDIADSATFTQLIPTNELFPKPVLNIIMLI